MKKVLVALSFCLLAMNSINAQEKVNNDARKSSSEKHKLLAEKLNLSPEQKEKMQGVQQEFRTKAKQLDENTTITHSEFKKQMQELREQRKNRANTILTDEQKSKMKAAREHQMKQSAAAHFEKLKTALQLTDAQQNLLKKKQDEVQQQMKAIHQNDVFTKEHKKEQIVALQEERKSYLKSVLTEEQVKKLEALHPARK